MVGFEYVFVLVCENDGDLLCCVVIIVVYFGVE